MCVLIFVKNGTNETQHEKRGPNTEMRKRKSSMLALCRDKPCVCKPDDCSLRHVDACLSQSHSAHVTDE
jgi:hypothetical protein